MPISESLRIVESFLRIVEPFLRIVESFFGLSSKAAMPRLFFFLADTNSGWWQ